jgi:hypothetical protein
VEPAPGQDTLRDKRAAAPAAVPQPTPPRRVEATHKVERAAPPIHTDASPAESQAPRQAAKPGIPFPASPSDASPAMNAAAPPADKLTAAPASPKARQETTTPSSAGASAQQAPAPLAEDERKTSPGVAGALAKRAQDSAAVTDEAQPHTVDEWILLIRRLKAEGRNDLAAKELAAFRTRYQQRADALLPADLRDIKP